MDARAVLREQGRWTKAAIISMLMERPGATRSAIAKALGITVQAVSVQVQELVAAGLLQDHGSLRPSMAGVASLQSDADAIARAAGHLRAPLTALTTISAVAVAPIAAGAQVGLWMVDGELVADPGRIGQSHGTAGAAASVGQEVLVTEPQGVVDVPRGRIEVIRVPGPAAGGIAPVDLDAIGAFDGLVAAVGTGAGIVARRLGQVDIPFAGAEGAVNAAYRGLDVRLFVSGDQAADALRTLESQGDRAVVTVRDAPLTK